MNHMSEKGLGLGTWAVPWIKEDLRRELSFRGPVEVLWKTKHDRSFLLSVRLSFAGSVWLFTWVCFMETATLILITTMTTTYIMLTILGTIPSVSHIKLFNPHNNPQKWVLVLSPVYIGGNWLSNQLKVTELVSFEPRHFGSRVCSCNLCAPSPLSGTMLPLPQLNVYLVLKHYHR